MSARKIGILGGTFDPVHVGHLSIAQAVMTEFGIEKVLLIPAHQPPHKEGKPMADAAHRLAMLRTAVRGLRGLEISDIELRRGGTSFTIDTINAVKKEYGDDAALYFIIGADSLVELADWKSIAELLRTCTFVTVTRPGYSQHHLDALEKKVPEADLARLREHYLKTDPIDISSTAIREKIRAGEPVTKLVRAPVERYIIEHGLYRE